MASEIFAWGYTGWRTQRADRFELNGFIDGNEFTVVSATAEEAERLFCRAARKAWLRRNARVACGLPGRTTALTSTADSYYSVSLALVVRVVVNELKRAVLCWYRR